MRILQVNSYADPIGGAEAYMLALSAELERRGHAVGVFGTSPEREEDGERLRIHRRPIYDRSRLVQDPETVEALGTFVARFRPEVLHLHNLFPLGQDFLRFLAGLKLPLVRTFHDYGTVCPNSWCVRGDGTPCGGGAGVQCFQHGCQKNYPFQAEHVLLTMARHRQLAGCVDIGISPSADLAQVLTRNGFKDVRHIPLFIDAAQAPPTSAAGLASNELLFLGRLEPEKGVGTLLEAMPLVLAADPAARLRIVGGGSLDAELRTRARRLGLGGRVEFVGKVAKDRVQGYYAQAAALVLPSIWSENSPLSIYEAMAAGLPVLASRIGGMPELVEDGVTGFLFTPRDAGDLADKALTFLRTPPAERERMSARMRARAADFGREEHVNRIEAVYAEAVSKPRPEPEAPTLEMNGEVEEIFSRLIGGQASHERHIHDLERYVAKLEADNRWLMPYRKVAWGLTNPVQTARGVARRLGLPKIFR